MRKNILITGLPKSGKSTLLARIISDIPKKVGFVTNEVRVDGERRGFEIRTHRGEIAMLASVDFNAPHKVSKYAVDVKGLDAMIPSVATFAPDDLLYLDEIGQMELFSENFKNLVLQYLNAPNPCIATISSIYDDEFTRAIKSREDIVLMHISPESRDEKEKLIRKLLAGLPHLKSPEPSAELR
jgi:nucleoside-triphosphatase